VNRGGGEGREGRVGSQAFMSGIAFRVELCLDDGRCHKRDLLQGQKRPTIGAKETYYGSFVLMVEGVTKVGTRMEWGAN
jgi:hypothetical protein